MKLDERWIVLLPITPEVLRIGPLAIHWYGLMCLAGFAAAQLPLADVAVGGLLVGTVLTLIYIPMFAYTVEGKGASK